MNTETIETADEVVDRAEIKDGAVLVEYSRTAAALADLQARYKGAEFDLTTTAGDKAARAARLELKTLRTSLEAKRQEFKAPALEFGRRIDAEAKRLTTEILALESPIDQQIKADEERREAERAARAEAERQRVAAIRQRIDNMQALVNRCAGADSATIAARVGLLQSIAIDDTFAEFSGEAEMCKTSALAQLSELHAASVAAEQEAARIKAEQEAEAARLAAERAEQQRIAAEQAEQARVLREQQEALQAQQLAAQQEIERQQAEAQAQRDEADRQARERLAAEQRRLDEQRAELERQQQAQEAARQAIEQARITQGQDSQQVLKAEPETADATDRETPANTSPVGGPMGAGQAAAAAPVADEPATLKLGLICERLGFVVSAAFLADVLHIQATPGERGAKLYRESQWQAICQQLQAHIGAMAELYAKEPA